MMAPVLLSLSQIGVALTSAPNAPPALPPAPPMCSANDATSACEVSLSVEPCVLPPYTNQLCVHIDKAWYAAVLAYRCVHRQTSVTSRSCLSISDNLRTFALLWEFADAGAFLTTTLQTEKANPDLPFTNAPATTPNTSTLIIVDTDYTLEFIRARTELLASPTSQYVVNMSLTTETFMPPTPPPLPASSPAPPSNADCLITLSDGTVSLVSYTKPQSRIQISDVVNVFRTYMPNLYILPGSSAYAHYTQCSKFQDYDGPLTVSDVVNTFRHYVNKTNAPAHMTAELLMSLSSAAANTFDFNRASLLETMHKSTAGVVRAAQSEDADIPTLYANEIATVSVGHAFSLPGLLSSVHLLPVEFNTTTGELSVFDVQFGMANTGFGVSAKSQT